MSVLPGRACAHTEPISLGVLPAPLVFNQKVALHYGLNHEILCFLAFLQKLLL